MQSGSRAKRHRSTPACARCYKLKQKCDRGTPRCLRCVAAGVDCVAINRQTSTEVPRSPVQYLELRLAELQRLDGQAPTDSENTPTQNGISDLEHEKVIHLATVSIINHTTPSLLRSHNNSQHWAKLFYPSERPPLKIPVRGIYHDIYPRTAGREYAAQFSQFNARKIPLEVAKRLFNNYKDNILPRFPCFMEADLTDHFDQFYTGDDHDANTNYFIVTLMLAVSSLTSKRHDFRKVAALSEALHADAMKRIDFLRDTTLVSLQCLLLLIQAALLLPHTANLWFMSGEAMRMAISLGLHQESDRSIVPGARHAELRRKLFWVTYQLERTIAISCGCPIAISDDHISTRLPFNGVYPRAPLDAFIKGMPRAYGEKQFLIQTRVCLIQSEINAVQFFDQPIPGQETSHDSWLQGMKDSIQELLRYATTEGVVNSWMISAAHQCLILLHRPCSRNIAVSESSLIEAASASIQLINASLKTAMAGGFVVAFDLANCSFQAGMVLLYALRNHVVEVQHATLVDDSNNALENLSRLFEILASRWPALSDTAYYIKELVDTNLRNPLGNLGSDYDMSVLEELDFLVTQRRIHSIYHRNIPLPSQQKNTPQVDDLNQISPGFLDDESWWRDFINDDFDMNHNDPPNGVDSYAIPPVERPSEQNLQGETRQRQPRNKGTEIDEIIEALPACSFCRDRRIKCRRQLPAYGPGDGSMTQDRWPSPSTLYFGPFSSLGCLRTLLKATPNWKVPRNLQEAGRRNIRGFAGMLGPSINRPPMPVALGPFHLFSRSANAFFPILEPDSLGTVVSQAYADENSGSEGSHTIFYLVLAIGSSIAKRNEPVLGSWAESFFHKATAHLDTTCDHSSRPFNILVLQRTLLICVYLLISPSSGDIWRHLGFAIRLFFDLSHRPSEDEDKHHSLFCTLTRTLYCLESQVSIAFSRPTLLIIGDSLRDELTQRSTGTLEEQISIFSYLISFQKMKIHSALLKNDSDLANLGQACSDVECQELRQGLDMWFIRWKELIASIQETQDSEELESWGELHYYHGLSMLAMLWPTPGGQPGNLCEHISKACIGLTRHQQLFAFPSPGTEEEKTPLIFPMNWSCGHLVLQIGLRFVDSRNSDQGSQETQSLRLCLSSLASLEADPSNLLTGQTMVLEEFCNLQEAGN
ncbi:hypothetical protein ACJZ2D_012304 [Fusarium nematophilum]